MPPDTQFQDAPLALDDFLPYRLAVAADAVSKGLAAVYIERFAISIPEWRIIANLGQHGTLTAGQVAQHSSLDKVQVTRAVQRLAARRLLTRRHVKVDRRQIRLALTADGARLLREIASLALDWERALLATVPERQRRDFLTTLALLAARAAGAAKPS